MAIHDLIRGNRDARLRARRADDPIRSLQHEMDDLFENFLGGWDIAPLSSGGRAFVPSINLAETDKAIEVTAELPGMEEKDVEVTLSNEMLTIKGEKKVEREEKEKNYYRVERSYGSFKRSIPVRAEADEANIAANFKNGVLKITMPKTAKAQAQERKIEIKKE